MRDTAPSSINIIRRRSSFAPFLDGRAISAQINDFFENPISNSHLYYIFVGHLPWNEPLKSKQFTVPLLLRQARKHKWEGFEKLLQRGLCIASNTGNISAVRALLEAKDDIPGPWVALALSMACQAEKIDVIKYILASALTIENPKLTRYDMQDTLSVACKSTDQDVLKFVVHHYFEWTQHTEQSIRVERERNFCNDILSLILDICELDQEHLCTFLMDVIVNTSYKSSAPELNQSIRLCFIKCMSPSISMNCPNTARGLMLSNASSLLVEAEWNNILRYVQDSEMRTLILNQMSMRGMSQ